MEAYPSAKIILTNRSEDSCYTSISDTLVRARHFWLHNLLQHIDWVTALVHTMRKETWRCLFDDDFEENGQAAMRDHYAEIRRFAQEQKREVLEFSVSEGWAPLCEFLEVDYVPQSPFPHINDGASWIVKMRHRAWRRLAAVVCQHISSIAFAAILLAIGIGIGTRGFL